MSMRESSSLKFSLEMNPYKSLGSTRVIYSCELEDRFEEFLGDTFTEEEQEAMDLDRLWFDWLEWLLEDSGAMVYTAWGDEHC